MFGYKEWCALRGIKWLIVVLMEESHEFERNSLDKYFEIDNEIEDEIEDGRYFKNIFSFHLGENNKKNEKDNK